jgi:hypothetical protein
VQVSPDSITWMDVAFEQISPWAPTTLNPWNIRPGHGAFSVFSHT